MEGKKASDFDQGLLNLFDEYVHGLIDRRAFLERAARFAVGGVSAGMLLDALDPKFAEAQQVAGDDKRLQAERVEYSSPNGSGTMRGYLARSASAAGKRAGVLVIHENRGLNPHIEDIARRVALENFVAFAPDALAPLGGYPGNEDKARELFPKLDQAKTREDFVAAAQYLKNRPDCTGRIGVVGFCYGGGIANLLATRLPDLGAAVPFYGSQARMTNFLAVTLGADLKAAVPFYGAAPETAAVPSIKAPLLIHYAENDERINAGWPAYEAALKAANVRYTMHMYPGTQHGFNNDTTPRYDPAAAKLAWQRTIEFFNTHLRG